MNSQQGMRILLVDDEPKITELLSFALRKENYLITSVQSGPEALELMSQNPINILVTDIRMPEMDGLELSRLVRAAYPDIQIIIISAHGDVDSAVEALKIGAGDFLQKPVDPKVLQLSLNSCVEKWQLRTELNNAYLALEQEKELLSVTLNSIGDGVITTDIEGNINLLNKVSATLTGWSAQEAKGKPLSEVFHIINEKTREVCVNPVEKVLTTGRIIGLANHTALISKGGSEKSIADSAAPIRNRDSEIVGTVLVFRDVTLENRVNAELTKTKKLESVGILAGGIAHDFNNILTGIMGNINLARGMMTGDHKAYSLLSAAEDASNRAAKLTQQLLTFSKGGEPIIELASIYDLVRESADFTLTGSGIACRIDRDVELWAATVDKGQVGQVVQNIVLNARQAMPEGGTINILCENFVQREVDHEVVGLGPGDYLRIVISDEGVGIPPDLVDKIFDPYFSTKQEGSGLGMAVTYAIIHKHKGHIKCTSTLGSGTSFTMYLPATRLTLSDKSHEYDEHKGHGKIMVMDDDEMIRNLTESMLELCGYQVSHACNGDEVLELYQQAMVEAKPFDVVIMDLTIPGGLGGKETIVKLLELDPKVRAIVSSGYSNDTVMANFMDYGFKGCLVKPYVSGPLTEVVSRVMLSH